MNCSGHGDGYSVQLMCQKPVGWSWFSEPWSRPAGGGGLWERRRVLVGIRAFRWYGWTFIVVLRSDLTATSLNQYARLEVHKIGLLIWTQCRRSWTVIWYDNRGPSLSGWKTGGICSCMDQLGYWGYFYRYNHDYNIRGHDIKCGIWNLPGYGSTVHRVIQSDMELMQMSRQLHDLLRLTSQAHW